MRRVLSGIQPSGDLHLGNYLGALRNWVAHQHEHDAFYCIVDLHALTLDIEPATLRANTFDAAVSLLAAGLDPATCTIFVQSQVPEHTRLAWLLECTATMGELRADDPVQGEVGGKEGVRVGLFTYPVLMAADILLYDAEPGPGGRGPAPAPRAGPRARRRASTTATARSSRARGVGARWPAPG